MLSKEKFVEIINKLKEVDDFVTETNDKARKLSDAVISDFFNAQSLSISHEGLVVELLENIFKDKDYISWWIYETDYGRNKDMAKVWPEDGTEIKLNTAEQLYEFLVKYINV